MTHKTHPTIQTLAIQDEPTLLFELVRVNLNHANLAQALRLHFPVKKSATASVVEVDSLGPFTRWFMSCFCVSCKGWWKDRSHSYFVLWKYFEEAVTRRVTPYSFLLLFILKSKFLLSTS
nr:hypothetical protein CFP56_55399 [Quercus suber]